MKNSRLGRGAQVVLVAVLVEAGLYVLGRMAPAFHSLIRPVYVVVAAAAVVAFIHALRGRGAGHDRRRGDRRHVS